jgi:hypothetical protein
MKFQLQASLNCTSFPHLNLNDEVGMRTVEEMAHKKQTGMPDQFKRRHNAAVTER